MRLHAPAYTLNILDPSWKYGIHRISPRFKLLFIFRAWKIFQFHGPNSTVVAPLWLQRSWTKTCKLFVHLSSSKCFRQKAVLKLLWSTSHKLLTMCCYFLGLALAEIFTKTRDEHLPWSHDWTPMCLDALKIPCSVWYPDIWNRACNDIDLDIL